MPTNKLTGFRAFAGSALVGCCLMLAGCSTSKSTRAFSGFDPVRDTRFWQPCQLYLLAAPHARLYVEVDAVEGCLPSDADLGKLREFLTTYCQKPGGIEIVRSDVIPLHNAKGVSSLSLAHQYLNGPPPNPSGTPPAFLYVLFYDSDLTSQSALADPSHHGVGDLSRLTARREHPRVDLLPYPALIYMNKRCGPHWLHDVLLCHEAGHVLGLANRPAYAANYHCLDRNCLMYKTIYIHLGRQLLGRDPVTQRKLCQRCAEQLANNARQTPPSNLRFIGSVLVRSEAGYEVLGLANRVKLIVGDVTEQDCRDFVTGVRAEAPVPGVPNGEWQGQGSGKAEMLRDPAKMLEILNRAKADPYEPVRIIASHFWFRTSIAWDCTQGQYRQAVELCHQALAINPKDDWNYNQLAWILATCSDAEVRNGREAVSAATKACKLTQWKQWSWIDTLAAAHAEVGDFKRALACEEQALRTGAPTESDLKEMRERLSLYQQSRPFRSQP